MATPAPGAGEDATSAHSGLMHSLRALLATLVATVRTRGELLQVEFEEERLRVAGILVVTAAALFFFSLAVLLFSFFLILLFWDTHRVMVSGLLAVAYLIIGIACVLAARRRSQVKSKLFQASLSALSKDGERLTQH